MEGAMIALYTANWLREYLATPSITYRTRRRWPVNNFFVISCSYAQHLAFNNNYDYDAAALDALISLCSNRSKWHCCVSWYFYLTRDKDNEELKHLMRVTQDRPESAKTFLSIYIQVLRFSM
jgi:hypothetical protein